MTTPKVQWGAPFVVEAHIKRVLAEAPPLTGEQKTQLAALFKATPARAQLIA